MKSKKRLATFISSILAIAMIAAIIIVYNSIVMQVTIKNGEISDVKCLSHDKKYDAYFDTAKSVIDEINEGKTWDVYTASFVILGV